MLKCAYSQQEMGFLDAAIEICGDEVPNVRLMACSLLCGLKQSIKLPDDVDALEKINGIATQLMADSDVDVAAAARRLSEDFKKVQAMRVGGVAMNDGGAFMALDKKKEEEEDLWSAREEQDRKKCDEQAAAQRSELLRTLSSSSDSSSPYKVFLENQERLVTDAIRLMLCALGVLVWQSKSIKSPSTATKSGPRSTPGSKTESSRPSISIPSKSVQSSISPKAKDSKSGIGVKTGTVVATWKTASSP